MGIFFADQRHFHNCFQACISVCIFRGAQKSVIEQPTILVGPRVKSPEPPSREMRQVVTKFLQDP